MRGLWHSDIFEKMDKSFELRLIPLNKAFPNIPDATNFRPVTVLSNLYKLLEAPFV